MSSYRTWKEVAIACIDAGQFQLAHMAALNIVVSVDHMDAIINHYENKGLFSEVIHLLEVGLSMEKAREYSLGISRIVLENSVMCNVLMTWCCFVCRSWHVHGAWHPVCQVQAREVDGAHSPLP